ncbi:hypothetical protein R3P38DRAFT_3548248, partial [Favolaschia claudopus]
LNTNGWGGGQLEVSMMREFHRAVQLEGMVSEHAFIQLLFGESRDREALGTVQDAANHARAPSRVLAGTFAEKSARFDEPKHDAMRLGIVNYYNQHGAKVHLPLGIPGANTEALDSFVNFYDYALLDGRRLTFTNYSRRGAASSLIQVHFNGEPHAGEIRHLFRHRQQGILDSEKTVLAFIEWLVPTLDTPMENNDFPWHDFPELGVETWARGQYAAPNEAGFPPQVLPLADIQCQVARGVVGYCIPPIWITTTMDR